MAKAKILRNFPQGPNARFKDNYATFRDVKTGLTISGFLPQALDAVADMHLRFTGEAISTKNVGNAWYDRVQDPKPTKGLYKGRWEIT